MVPDKKAKPGNRGCGIRDRMLVCVAVCIKWRGETGYVERVQDECRVPSNVSAGNKAPRCGGSKLACLDAALGVKGGVEPDLIRE